MGTSKQRFLDEQQSEAVEIEAGRDPERRRDAEIEALRRLHPGSRFCRLPSGSIEEVRPGWVEPFFHH